MPKKKKKKKAAVQIFVCVCVQFFSYSWKSFYLIHLKCHHLQFVRYFLCTFNTPAEEEHNFLITFHFQMHRLKPHIEVVRFDYCLERHMRSPEFDWPSLEFQLGPWLLGKVDQTCTDSSWEPVCTQ